MKRYRHISALLFDQPWATTERALDSLIRRVEAAERREEIDLDAVSTKLGRPLDNTGNRVEMRDNVAVLDVNGPIFRYANIMTQVSGATSVELLARDFQTAVDNPRVSHILLNIDSPGGEIGGIADFAEIIHASSKPVTAFIDGLGASAAYWLASAAGKVYASNTSFAGSIGVVASLTDRSGAQERQGIKTYTIVSSQSPRKVNDPATDEGRAAIQEMVDSLGAIFVDTVAKYRAVSSKKVLSDFGKGFVHPARVAYTVGMIDGVTNYESLVAALQAHQQPTTTAAIAAQEEIVSTNDINPAAQSVAVTPANSITNEIFRANGGATNLLPFVTPTVEGHVIPNPALDGTVAANERNRIQSILSLPEAQGREDLARTLAFEAGMTLDTAKRILASAPQAAAPAGPSFLEREMAKIKNPTVGAGNEPDEATAEAQKILAFVPAHAKFKVQQGN